MFFHKGTPLSYKRFFQKKFPYIFYVFSIMGLIISKRSFQKKIHIFFPKSIGPSTLLGEDNTFICLFTLDGLMNRKRLDQKNFPKKFCKIFRRVLFTQHFTQVFTQWYYLLLNNNRL